MTTVAPEAVYFGEEKPELWMPTGGNPACVYERTLVAAVRGTGAQPEPPRVAAHGGLLYLFFLDVGFQAIQHDTVRRAFVAATYHLHRFAAAAASPTVPTAVASSASVPDEDGIAITAEEQIDSIQDALSLGISHIAEIVGVARGTVHSWARGDTPIPRDPAVARRLRGLYRLGAKWRTHSEQEIGRLLTAPLGDGEPSLYDLLRAATWDRDRIERALLLLADRVDERYARSPREELRAGSASAPEVARHHLRSLIQRGRSYGR